MTPERRKALVRTLKKAAAIYVNTGGHPKLKDQPYILLTEAVRDEIVAALSAIK